MSDLVAGLGMFKLCSIKVPLSSDDYEGESEIIWIDCLPQTNGTENKSITSKRVLNKT